MVDPAVMEPDTPAVQSRSRIGTISVSIILIAIVVFWVYILFIADKTPPDKLESDAFAVAAEAVCAQTLTDMKDAGIYNVVASSPEERAELVEQANVHLEGMMQQLRTIEVPDEDDLIPVDQWISDYGTFVEDRATWAVRLAAGEDVQFSERVRTSGEPTSKSIDAFAIVNDMESCKTPAGV